MIIVLVVLIALAASFLLCLAGGFLFFNTVVRRKAPPLSPRERELCREIVRRGRGYPFICRLFVKDGVCGCRPCRFLENELKRQG